MPRLLCRFVNGVQVTDKYRQLESEIFFRISAIGEAGNAFRNISALGIALICVCGGGELVQARTAYHGGGDAACRHHFRSAMLLRLGVR